MVLWMDDFGFGQKVLQVVGYYIVPVAVMKVCQMELQKSLQSLPDSCDKGSGHVTTDSWLSGCPEVEKRADQKALWMDV